MRFVHLSVLPLLVAATAAQISIQTPLSAPRDVLNAFELRDGTLQELLLPQSGRARFEVRLMLGGQVQTLALEPASVLAPDFQLLVTDATGTHLVPRPVETTYSGTVLGVVDSTVLATLSAGQLEAHIRTPAGLWTIQPISGLVPVAPRHFHIVYRNADVLPSAGRCGVTEQGEKVPPGGGVGPAALNYCEIGLDCDLAWYVRNGSNVTAAAQAAFNLIFFTNGIYQTDVEIRYIVTAIIVRTTAVYTSGPNLGCGSPGLLQEFQTRWQNNHGNITRDLAHLFSGDGAFSGTVGCAFVGVVCTTGGYGASRATSTNAAQNLQLVAHEIGHNWSAGHCDASPPCNIMCSGIGGCSGVGNSFSAGERAQILAHKATRTCLSSPTSFVPHPDVYYRLTTVFRPTLAMDVINDGVNNNRMVMAAIGAFTGQFWRFSPIGGFPGRHRLSSFWRGLNLPMDIINGGAENDQPILSPIGPFTGQVWSLTDIPQNPGHVSLTTDFRGQNLALEGHAGTTGNRPQLIPFGPFTGQAWLLTPLFSADPATITSFGTACRGRGGVPALQATGGTGPWLNETFTGEVTNVLNGTLSNLIIGARLAVPLDLASILSPGCFLRVSLTVQLPNPVGGGRATFSLPVPNSLALVSQTLSIQAAVIDPNRGVGDPLIAMTNGLDLRFGLR